MLVVVALVLWLALFAVTIRAKGAWKGWMARRSASCRRWRRSVISRAGLYGSGVGIELYYAAIPTVFLVVGAAEAVDLRLGPTPVNPSVRRARLLVVGAAYGVFCLAFVWGGVGTRDVEGYAGAARQIHATCCAASTTRPATSRRGAEHDSPQIVPLPFAPFNRADRVLASAPTSASTSAGPKPARSIPSAGRLRRHRPLVDDPAVDGPPPTAYGVDDARIEGGSWCFDTTAESLVRWDLPEPVAGTGLTISFAGRVDRTSTWSWFVTDGTADFDRASYDDHRWGPSDRHGFETVRQEAVGAVALGGLAPGVRLCIDQVQLLEVHPKG